MPGEAAAIERSSHNTYTGDIANIIFLRRQKQILDFHITEASSYLIITLRRAHKWAQNELNLRLKVISFAIMTPSEQFYVS